MSHFDLVWDRYIADTLKATARLKSGWSTPTCWLRTSTIELAKLLISTRVNSSVFSQRNSLHLSSKKKVELVVTNGNQIVCVPAHPDVHLLTPCNREEADSRMMLHVAHVAQHEHHQILVNTVDTDFVVLVVMVAATLPAGIYLFELEKIGLDQRSP